MGEISHQSLNYLPFGVTIVNNDGGFVFINNPMIASFGFSDDEFLNLKLRDLFPYSILPQELAGLPEELRYTEFQMIRSNGSMSTFGVSISCLKTSDSMSFRLIIFQDLAEIEKARREGLIEWLSYAQRNVALILYQLSKMGPEVVEELGTSIIKEKEKTLIKLGVFTAAAIGQGGGFSTGLFGPLPVPENDNFLCLIFTWSIDDPTQTDPRAKGKRFSMLNVVFPRNLESLFVDRRRLKIVLKEYLFSLSSIVDLNKDFLDQIRRSLIFFERETDPLKEITLEKKLNAIFELSQSLTSTSDLESSFEAISVFAERTLDFQYFAAGIVDRVKEEIWFISYKGYTQDVKQIRLPINEKYSVISHVAFMNQPALISDVKQSEFYYEASPNVKSELAVPISSEGEVLGVLNVESADLNAFTEEDEAILKTLAGTSASVIRRYELERQLRAVHELGHLIAHTQDFKESFEYIANFASRALHLSVFSIFEVLDSGEMRILAQRGYDNIDIESLNIRVDSPEYFVSKVARTRQPLYIDNVKQYESYYEADPDVIVEYALPINIPGPAGKCVGVLNTESPRPFNDTDKFLIEVLANQALILMRFWKP